MINFNKIFLTFVFFALPVVSFCQFTVTIEISNLRNNNGQILVEFCNEKEIKLKGIIQAVENKKCTIVIENLKPGKYSFRYFHDENKNENLDLNWFGIPTEGFGFSNNAEGTFGPPSFQKTIFVIKGNITLKCLPTYYYVF